MIDADVAAAIAVVEERFTAKLAAQQALHDQNLASLKEAASVRASTLEERLDGMNKFREALADQTANLITRQEYMATKDALTEKTDQLRISLESRIQNTTEPMESRLEAMGRPNWALMTSVASVFVVVVTGIWLVIGLKIDATIAPVTLDIAQVRAIQTTRGTTLHDIESQAVASTASDVLSRSDRGQLNDRLRSLEALVSAGRAARQASNDTIQARLTEIETQFCAADIIRNLMHAQDMRVFSIIWHKTMPTTNYPTDNAYYPQICNRGQTAASVFSSQQQGPQ